MKTLSLKLDDEIYSETEKVISKLKRPRNRYINEALSLYNQFQNRRLVKAQLKKESKLVAEDSLEVLSEFEKLYQNED
ncbi:MAG: hypothetical protein JST58_04285 [Bacteroidetes bacterium]|nr:hypothetical protein [Bacteroidota bacterium]